MRDHPPIPRAPLPTRKIFDPYNSSSTGHQYAENKLSASSSWRESRNYKLAHQFRDASRRGGSTHLADLVGAGSVNWKIDGRKDNGDWEKSAPGLRETGWQDIRGLMSGSRKRPSGEAEERSAAVVETKKRKATPQNDLTEPGTYSVVPIVKKIATSPSQRDNIPEADLSPKAEQLPQIFRGLTIYLNGSTAPEITDHKLKQLFMQHGGNASIALGRRTVTHVILGKTCGGGLASGKIHREVSTIGGKGIKYVTAQWVIDSVQKGIRQPEARYLQPVIAKRIGGSNQVSVKSIFALRPTEKENG